MNRVLRIVFQLTLVFVVSCQDVCEMDASGHFEICRRNPWKLFSVEQLGWRFNGQTPSQLQLAYPQVTNVGPFLFVKRTEITILTLNLANAVLNIDPLSFNNLPNLKILEINNGTVLLKEKLFQHLQDLESLTLAVNESIYSLNDVLLEDLKSLSTLEILNAKRVSVCPRLFSLESRIETMSQLTYRGGSFDTLQVLAFSCLPNLEVLNITGSDLKVIETYAFGRLRKLRVLELSGNRKLTHIPAYTFDNFKALDSLLLMDNQIRTIDGAAFRNLFHPLKTLNMSGNDIKQIKEKSFDGLRCGQLDLSANPTWKSTSLANNSFSKAQIQELFVSNATYSRRNYNCWGLQTEKTITHYRFSDGRDYFTEGTNSTSTILVYENDCRDCGRNAKFTCCIRDHSHLTSLKAKPGVKETEVTLDLDVTSVEADAFFSPAITKLTFLLTYSQKLTIVPLALDSGALRQLQILNGPVVLQRGTFIGLNSLKTLAIQVQQGGTMLCEVLPDLPQLEYLERHNHQGFHDICHQKCRKFTPPMKRLMYMTGTISVVNKGSLSCLKNLERLHYYGTSTSSIEEGAFRGLENLKSLILFHTSLQRVPALVFSPLVSLRYLQIDETVIQTLDSHQFKQMVDNTRNYADYSDQLFFGLSHSQLLKFSPVNLYRDDLAEIHILRDEIRWISQDDSREYSSRSVSRMSFLPPGVFPVLAASDMPSQVVDRDFGDYCRNSSLETPFKICVHARNTLVSVNTVGTSRRNVSLTINVSGISSIQKGAFSSVNINQLLLKFSNTSRLRAAPKSFEGLSGLESLILHTGPLALGPNLFQELGSLVELRFSYRTASGTRLCDVLMDLPKLRILSIYSESHIDICHASCWTRRRPSMSQLQYIGGGITILESGSFKCLRELEHLTISDTNLMIIQPDAFEGLDRIKNLELMFNNHLKHIPAGLFDHLATLGRLFLQGNLIESIGVQAFKFSERARVDVLDLSSNNISVIQRWTFANLSSRKVDLSYNHISDIQSESFQGSNIARLFLLNDKNLLIERLRWGLSKSTTILNNSTDHDFQ